MKYAFLLVPLFCGFAISPASADAVSSLLEKSRVAESRGDAPDAILYMQAALVADPARASTYVALGDFHARAHQAELAQQYYEEALDLNPWEAAAKQGMAQLAQSGKPALDKN